MENLEKLEEKMLSLSADIEALDLEIYNLNARLNFVENLKVVREGVAGEKAKTGDEGQKAYLTNWLQDLDEVISEKEKNKEKNKEKIQEKLSKKEKVSLEYLKVIQEKLDQLVYSGEDVTIAIRKQKLAFLKKAFNKHKYLDSTKSSEQFLQLKENLTAAYQKACELDEVKNLANNPEILELLGQYAKDPKEQLKDLSDRLKTRELPKDASQRQEIEMIHQAADYIDKLEELKKKARKRNRFKIVGFINDLVNDFKNNHDAKSSLSKARKFLFREKLKNNKYVFKKVFPNIPSQTLIQNKNLQEIGECIKDMHQARKELGAAKMLVKSEQSTLSGMIKSPFRKLLLIGRKSEMQKINTLLKTVKHKIKEAKRLQQEQERKEVLRPLKEILRKERELLEVWSKSSDEKIKGYVPEQKIEVERVEKILYTQEVVVCAAELKRLWKIADHRDKHRIYYQLKVTLNNPNITEEQLKKVRNLIHRIQIKHHKPEDFEKAIQSDLGRLEKEGEKESYLDRLHEVAKDVQEKSLRKVTSKKSFLKRITTRRNKSENEIEKKLKVIEGFIADTKNQKTKQLTVSQREGLANASGSSSAQVSRLAPPPGLKRRKRNSSTHLVEKPSGRSAGSHKSQQTYVRSAIH